MMTSLAVTLTAFRATNSFGAAGVVTACYGIAGTLRRVQKVSDTVAVVP